MSEVIMSFKLNDLLKLVHNAKFLYIFLLVDLEGRLIDLTMQRTRGQFTPLKNGCFLTPFAPSREPNLFLGSLCNNLYISCFAWRLTCTKTKCESVYNRHFYMMLNVFLSGLHRQFVLVFL